MAHQIARGLFRFWLVISVFWIAGVAAETWWTFPTDVEVPGASARPIECAGKSTDECVEILERLGKNPWDAYPRAPDTTFDPNEYAAFKACMDAGKSKDQCAANLKPAFDPSKPYQIVRDGERRTAGQFAAILALAPPIFILALGSALGWAFKGFNSASAK
jgi:hypothetical protein